jgi:FkbM family methyltransferase
VEAGFTLRLGLERFSERHIRETVERGETYEPEATRLLLAALKPGDLFIDVGAHVGYFTMLAAMAVEPGGAVVSVEANPDNADRLEANLADNGFGNVTLHRAAAGAKPGTADFHINADNDGGHALWDPAAHPWNEKTKLAPETISIAMTTLDAVADGRTPRAIKIDTEGAEHEVLKGASGLLGRKPAFIIAEANRFGLKQMGSSEAALREYVTGFGYTTYAMNDRAPWFVPLPAGRFLKADGVFNLLFSTDDALRSLGR